ADDAPAVDLLHLSGLERVDHAVLFGHRPDPAVALDAHAVVPWGKARERAIVGGRPGRVYPRPAGPPAAAAGSADRGVRPAGPRSESRRAGAGPARWPAPAPRPGRPGPEPRPA